MMRDITKEYDQLGDIPILLYKTVCPTGKEKVAVVLMHSDSNYFETVQAKAIAERGYLCFVSNATQREKNLDSKFIHLGKVVAFAKNYPGVEKVVLFGHSGGATLMSGYQAIAENGQQIFQTEKQIIRLDDVGELPKADGLMLLDANFGNGVMTLLSLDPSIIDEGDPLNRDRSLDLFDPIKGYRSDGDCAYSDAFIRRYLLAQGKRMNRLIAFAQHRCDLIARGKGNYIDDEPMTIAGGDQVAPLNKLFPQVPSFFSHTKEEWPLIHSDGSITIQTVPCLRQFRTGKDQTNVYHFGALQTTVKSFLKSSAVLADDTYGYDETTLYGVDFTSSYCVTVGNASYIAAPMLLMGMTGSYEYIAAEHIYRSAIRCEDKTVAFVEGAGHNFTPAKEEYGDTVSACFDYVDQWIIDRFL